MFKNKYLYIFLISLGASGLAQAADIGRVLLSSGEVHALRGGQAVRLSYGDLIQDRDVLRTGAASNLQVRFNDESVISLRENSELGIDSFQFGKTVPPNDERALLRLVKGGLRTITGLVGRSRPQNYSLSSVTATIGIRGTDYAATLCQGDCRNDDGTPAKDGLYGRVIGQSGGSNSISITNERFERVFGIDQNFYVADARSEPQRLLEAPPFVANRLEGRGKANTEKSADKNAGTGTERAAGGGNQDSRGSTDRVESTPLRAALNSFVATEQRNAEGTLAFLPLPTLALAVSDGVGNGGAFALASQLTLSGTTLIGLNFSGKDFQNETSSFSGSTTLAAVVNTGSSSDINVHWGRWTSGTINDNGTIYNLGTAPNGQLHYIYGTMTAPDIIGSRTGTFSFARIDGTTPTDSVGSGNVASSFSVGNISVDFTARTASLASLSMQFPTGVNYNFANPVPLQLKTQSGGVTIDGTQTNNTACFGGICTSGSAATITVRGTFFGPSGHHIGTTIRTHSSIAGSTSSAQLFKCSTCP